MLVTYKAVWADFLFPLCTHMHSYRSFYKISLLYKILHAFSMMQETIGKLKKIGSTNISYGL